MRRRSPYARYRVTLHYASERLRTYPADQDRVESALRREFGHRLEEEDMAIHVEPKWEAPAWLAYPLALVGALFASLWVLACALAGLLFIVLVTLAVINEF